MSTEDHFDHIFGDRDSSDDEASHVASDSYARLVPHLATLCEDFGSPLSAESQANVLMMVRVFQNLDTHINGLTDAFALESFLSSMVSFLFSIPTIHTAALPDSLIPDLIQLKDVLSRNGELLVFINSFHQMIEHIQTMRKVTGVMGYIRSCIGAGEARADMTFLTIDCSEVSLKLMSYLRHLAGTGSLYMQGRRAQQDHERGIISVKPGMLFRGAVKADLASHGVRLLASHPHPERVRDYLPKILGRL